MTMRVNAPYDVGHKPGGGALLHKGENDTTGFSNVERIFVDELVKIGLCTVIADPLPSLSPAAVVVPDPEVKEPTVSVTPAPVLSVDAVATVTVERESPDRRRRKWKGK